jgi:hypothetical protein
VGGELRTSRTSRSLRRACLLAAALACALAAAAPAGAAPHLSKAQQSEISTLVNRFVNDVVRRQDLADGWRLAGPDLRSGTTRAAWVAGRQVPVQQFATRDRDFSKAWYAVWKQGNEMGLTVTIRTGRGASAKLIEEVMGLARRHDRWLVNVFYPDGIIRVGGHHRGSCVSSKCAVTGMRDYAASSGGGEGASRSPIGEDWVWVVLGALAGIPLSGLLGVGLWSVWRDRRARIAYLNSRSP